MRHWTLPLTLLTLIALAAACGGGGNDDDDSPGPANADDPLAALIQWDRSPTAVVFRAEVTSADAETDFFARAEIPLCTIYGDNRVVWTVEGVDDPLEGVLTGPVDDVRIRSFVDTQTVYRGLYTYGQEADLQGDSEPPVVETMTIAVNDLVHVTDIFSGWSETMFQDIVTDCRNLSPRPQIYRPTGAWVRALARPYNPNQPSVLWEPEVTGLDLSELAASGEPVWVTGRTLDLLWTYRMRAALDTQYSQAEGNFVVALEIPGVTRFSPPAP